MSDERFSEKELAEIRNLSSREAQRRHGVGFRSWQRIRTDQRYCPRRTTDARAEAERVETILASVAKAPHLNTVDRARRLQISTKIVHRILKDAGLTKLNARLQHAGYKVEVLRPLQVARMRRIVAAYPGALTHIDYKTFGFLRGSTRQAGFRVGGYVVVDTLTAFATLKLARSTGALEAVQALEKHRKNAPFDLEGIIFSDNGKDFLSDAFVQYCAQMRWFQRTTKVNHPWSNGKVEALNKTLKYQCFPAIQYADLDTLDELERVTDEWMKYYNHRRAHNGHANRGLPPGAFFDLWKRTSGTHVEKLVELGLIKLDDEWSLRMMGDVPGNAGERPGGSKDGDGKPFTKGGLPFAFIMERNRGSFAADNSDRSHMIAARAESPRHALSNKRMLLAR